MAIHFKSKLLACALGTFLPGTGLNWLYLKGPQCLWLYLHLITIILGILGWFDLTHSEDKSLLSWFAVSLGEISLLTSWLTSIVLGLRPDPRFDAYFNPATTQKNQSGWPVILCVIISLMVGAFILMAGLAIIFEQYFNGQIEATRKISQ